MKLLADYKNSPDLSQFVPMSLDELNQLDEEMDREYNDYYETHRIRESSHFAKLLELEIADFTKIDLDQEVWDFLRGQCVLVHEARVHARCGNKVFYTSDDGFMYFAVDRCAPPVNGGDLGNSSVGDINDCPL